jgi:hypothetical protein
MDGPDEADLGAIRGGRRCCSVSAVLDEPPGVRALRRPGRAGMLLVMSHSDSSVAVMNSAVNCANRSKDQPRLRRSISYASTEVQVHRMSAASATVTPSRR